MRITRPSVRTRGHRRPCVYAAFDVRNLEDGKASSESVRGRAAAAVEYGSGLERTERRRAQGHCPPPDARTRAGALNAPDASPPNAQVTGGVIGNRLPSHQSFCSLPTERPRACQDAGNKDGTSNRDPLETPKVSAPDISILHGVRPSTEQGSFQGTSRTSTDNTTATPPDPPHTVQACDLRTGARRRAGPNAGARVIITGLSRWDGSRPCCTEASSRSALHAAIDPYSNIYACTLGLSLEL